MRLYEIIWKDEMVNKLASKHQVMPEEVEQVLFSRPHTRYAEHGRVAGEDLHVAYGRTEAGRYLIVFFLHKAQHGALPISARDMTCSERRYDERQKKNA